MPLAEHDSMTELEATTRCSALCSKSSTSWTVSIRAVISRWSLSSLPDRTSLRMWVWIWFVWGCLEKVPTALVQRATLSTRVLSQHWPSAHETPFTVSHTSR